MCPPEAELARMAAEKERNDALALFKASAAAGAAATASDDEEKEANEAEEEAINGQW